MSSREADTVSVIVGIAAVALIVISGLCLGYDETLMKLGIVAIAGIAGFSLRGLIRWN